MNIFGYYDKFNTKSNTITIAKYGSAGFIGFQTKEFWANDVVYLIEPKEFIDNRYLYHLLLNNQNTINSFVLDAIPSHLPIDKLKQLPLTITSLNNQQKISNQLDIFNDLVNNVDDCIPLLNTLTIKQYTYYRNYLFKLLENK